MSNPLDLYRQNSRKPSSSNTSGAAHPPGQPRAASSPHDSAESGNIPWPELVRIGNAPEPPEFPLDVLPEPLAQLAREMAAALNCSADMPAVVMLAMAGGAIGAARSVGVKANYCESAALYLCIVAPPGGAKTPILKMLRGPFDARQQAHLEAFQGQIESWKKQDEETRGPKPVCERVVVGDATVESRRALRNRSADPSRVGGAFDADADRSILASPTVRSRRGRGKAAEPRADFHARDRGRDAPKDRHG